jgi:TRAP-type uncharacterized transport system substrate-binding protein
MGTIKEDVKENTQAIYEIVVQELRSWLQFVHEAWPLIGLLLIAIGIALWFAKPAPPTRLLMATGSKGGSYEMIAKEYVDFFAKNGVHLELVETAGAEENIARLIDHNDPLQAAFVQSGLVNQQNSQELLSLGSVAYEPAWIFYRNDKFNTSHQEYGEILKFPMAIGEPGSGTHRQVQHFLKANGMDPNNKNLKSIPTSEGVEAFIRGDVMSIFIVDGFESKNVQKMLHQKNASVGNFNRAAAYTRLMPYYHELEIPQGALNLEENKPNIDVKIIAPSTNLLIDKNMHPAIQLLFLQAAQKINGGRSFFSKYGEFPKFMESIVPESEVAKRFYEKGTPVLMNYLPFWLAEFIDRLFILILPLVAFAYPLLRTMPSYRLNRARSRINEVYGALKFFEQQIATDYNEASQQSYLDTIDSIEKNALALRVPKSLGSDYYSLRTSIDFVRMTLNRLAAA